MAFCTRVSGGRDAGNRSFRAPCRAGASCPPQQHDTHECSGPCAPQGAAGGVGAWAIADQAKARGIPEERVVEDVILAAQPNKSFVDYDHLAGMMLYLASDMGASTTGAVLAIDGGWTAT